MNVKFQDEEYKTLFTFLSKLTSLDIEYLIQKNQIDITNENLMKVFLKLQQYEK